VKVADHGGDVYYLVITIIVVYALVFKGLMSILAHRRAVNDLGHPLCDNLRIIIMITIIITINIIIVIVCVCM